MWPLLKEAWFYGTAVGRCYMINILFIRTGYQDKALLLTNMFGWRDDKQILLNLGGGMC